MTTIATLLVELVGDASKYSQALAQSRSETSSWQGAVSGFANDARDGLGTIGSGLILGGLALATTAMVGLGAAAKSVMDEGAQWEKGQAQLNAVLASTQGAAGVTAETVNGLADKYSHLTMFQDDAVLSAENMLLTFTNIKDDVFPQATQTVLDMSQALGQDTKNSAIQLGKALNDPILGVTALRRVGVNFTEDQKALIKTLVDSGDTLSAQKIILQELQTEFGGSAEAAGKTLPGQLAIMQQSFRDVEQSLYQRLLPVLTDLVTMFNDQLARPEVKAFIDSVTEGIVDMASKITMWLPDIIRGFQMTFGWLMDNKGLIVGAVAAIGLAIGIAAWTALAPLLPALAVMAAVAAIVWVLYQAWVTDFGGIQEKTAEVWSFLQPIFQGVWDWLQTQWPIALQTASDFWTNVLKPALKSTWEWMNTTLFPFLKDLWQTVQDNGKAVKDWGGGWDDLKNNAQGAWNWMNTVLWPFIQNLVGWIILWGGRSLEGWALIWQHVFLPAVKGVLEWLSGVLWPFLVALGNFLEAVEGVKLKIFAGLWTNILLPALQAVGLYIIRSDYMALKPLGDFVSTVLGPILKNIIDRISIGFVLAIKSLTDNIKNLTTWLSNMATTLNNLTLPDWLTPGSPTPFELGLLGINDALALVARKGLPELSMGLNIMAPASIAVPSAAVSGGSGIAGQQGASSRANSFDYDRMAKSFALAVRDALLQIGR